MTVHAFPPVVGPEIGRAFAAEPLDRDPGPQPGDPGAEPAPASLEPVATAPVDAVAALASQAVTSAFALSRHQAAMIEMFAGLGSMVNLTIAAVRQMQAEDFKPISPVTARLAESLRELSVHIEARHRSLN